MGLKSRGLEGGLEVSTSFERGGSGGGGGVVGLAAAVLPLHFSINNGQQGRSSRNSVVYR